MAVYDILPNEDLRDADVRDTLNANGGKCDDERESYFVGTANINPFSKHKPVRLNKMFCQDIDSSEPNYMENWWTGDDGNCGLVPYSVSHYTNIPEKMVGGMNGWIYQLPLGNSSSPYRIGDFRAYKADALPMLHDFYVPSRVMGSSTQSSITGTCAVEVDDLYNLSFADFPIFKDYYFGMYIRAKNGSGYAYKTSDIPLGEGGTDVTISALGLSEGGWEAYPFICTKKQDGVIENIANYYTIPMVQKVDFEIVNTLMVIKVEAYYNYNNAGKKTSVTISSIKVFNRTGSGMTFRNNTLQLRYIGDNLTEQPVSSTSINEFTAPYSPEDEPTEIPLRPTQTLINVPDSSKSYYIRVTLNTSQYTVDYQIEEDPGEL